MGWRTYVGQQGETVAIDTSANSRPAR